MHGNMNEIYQFFSSRRKKNRIVWTANYSLINIQNEKKCWSHGFCFMRGFPTLFFSHFSLINAIQLNQLFLLPSLSSANILMSNDKNKSNLLVIKFYSDAEQKKHCIPWLRIDWISSSNSLFFPVDIFAVWLFRDLFYLFNTKKKLKRNRSTWQSRMER